MNQNDAKTMIAIDADPVYAPCCYLICRAKRGPGRGYDWNTRDEENTILVQTDWDFPGIASTFGWTPCPDCGNTDGTVDCAHRKTDDMMDSAREYLDDCVNRAVVVEDPGYFG